jgi:hypothetical protein
MTRKSLRPQLNQIRGWVKQGRTDAWIAHQLEVTVQQVESFKRRYNLNADDDSTQLDEVDLRAEDDAAIAEELDQAEQEAEKQRAEEARKAEEERERKLASQAESTTSERPERRTRRSRTPRSRRSGSSQTFEGTFDHGEEGYGLWLDPAIADSPTYAEHWAGHRPVEVSIEEDQIVIRRALVEDSESPEPAEQR